MPGAPPPMSDWCARLQTKATSRPPANTGRAITQSGRWLPPACHGSLSTKTSPGSISPAKSRSTARTAKPPPPEWMGIPSAWETSQPSAPHTKQVKSWAWLKMGLRAVRTITSPICRVT